MRAPAIRGGGGSSSSPDILLVVMYYYNTHTKNGLDRIYTIPVARARTNENSPSARAIPAGIEVKERYGN